MHLHSSHTKIPAVVVGDAAATVGIDGQVSLHHRPRHATRTLDGHVKIWTIRPVDGANQIQRDGAVAGDRADGVIAPPSGLVVCL